MEGVVYQQSYTEIRIRPDIEKIHKDGLKFIEEEGLEDEVIEMGSVPSSTKQSS